MTQYLPPNLLALFAPRDPLPYTPPLDKLPWEKKNQPYAGVAQYIQEFEDPKDTPPPTRVETKDERKERKRKERAEQVAYKLEQDLALWVPGGGEGSGTTDPFKTLFITRVNFDTSESKLRREFEVYGPVRKIFMITNKTFDKPRGYAFVEYEHERDMHSAYKHADGKKIDGRRVLVDVERGRTIKGWRPRRLGGGLGGTRKGGPDVNTKYSGREDNFREDRSRSRSRSPAMRRKQRRSRSRERPPRRRSRSRERRRSRDRGDRVERERVGDRDEDVDTRKRNRRSRSRERKRSRSRERKRIKRSRSHERRGRSRDNDRNHTEKVPEPASEGDQDEGYVMDASQIKQEPVKEGYDKYPQAAGEGGQYEQYDEHDEQEQGNGYNGEEYSGEATEYRTEYPADD